MALVFFLLSLLSLQTSSNSTTELSDRLAEKPDSLVVRNWTIEDGLPVNSVNSLIQDQEGFIWVTTYDGIARFNGLNFKVYNRTNNPGMPQNRTVLLYEQEGKGLWITAENDGVMLMREDTTIHFNDENGFTTSNVTEIIEDPQGRMWMGTYEGLFRYENGAFSRVFNRKTPSQNRVVSLFEDNDGSIWAGTFDGLVHLEKGKMSVYNRTPGTVHNEFSMIKRAQDGTLWVGTRTGLFVMKNDSLVQPDKFKSISGEYINAIYNDAQVSLISTDRGLYLYDNELKTLQVYESQYGSYQHFYRDSRGTLWMVRNNGELFCLRGDHFAQLKKPAVLSDYHINRITEDREGNIWLTTARNGIVRLKRTRATMIGMDDGLSGKNILGLFEDSQGRFWVGTRDKGLNIIDGGKIHTLREGRGIPSDIVQSIAEDKSGNIWVGYYQRGIERINDEGFKNYDLGFNGRVNDVRAIYISTDSTIWLGTYGGLIKFDPENKDHIIYDESDGLAGHRVRYIDEGQNGGLWIATGDGGVSHFKDGTFTNFTVQQGLSSNNIRSLYADEFDPGTIWVGTEDKGLNRIRGDEITSVGKPEGLPDHIIHYISQDQYGWLWMSSNRGVFKIRKEELNTYLDGEASYFGMVHYGKESGMENPECNGAFQQGGLKTSQGTFWFSTQEGVAVFDIQSPILNGTPPKVYIQNIYANGNGYSSNDVDLEAGVNDFQINVQALTFVTPAQTPFRYKLEGFKKDWSEIRNTRQIVYRDVPAGRYTFKVLAANNDGVWSKEAATVSIKVTPLFYQQLWFYLVVLALLGIGYFGVSKLRYRYLMRRQKEMERVIDDQTAALRNERDEVQKQKQIIETQAQRLEESNKSKDKFFSIIGHDLRSPFQLLLGHSRFLIEDYQSMNDEEIKDDLLKIERAANRLLNLVENLLNWASLQADELKPDPEWINIGELIDQNMEIFLQSAEQKNINLEVGDNIDQQIYADRNMINTVIRNLLSNAIKFTESGGTVAVCVESENENVCIQVSDNGIGMPEAMVDKLMRLDENTSREGTENETGTGLGLIICKDMVSFHHGEIRVESQKGEGTKFRVFLPQNAFAEMEEVDQD